MGTIVDVRTEEATNARKTNTFRRGAARADSDRKVSEDRAEETTRKTHKRQTQRKGNSVAKKKEKRRRLSARKER